jgi:uncharacterized protein YkwD
MSRSHRLVLVVAVLAPTLVMSSVHAGSGACYRHSTKDRLLAKKTNTARVNAGVRKLSLDPHLSRVAKRQARAMARKRTLYHTRSLGSLVTRWQALAENVGYSSTVKSVHRAFMSSLAHKANLLRASYRHLGIGVTKKGGYVWAVAVFESRRNPGTTLSMPSC